MKGTNLMRKEIFKAFLILAVIGVSSSAWASGTSIVGVTTIGGPSNTFSPSSKVGISVASNATSYVASSCHVNGTFEYGVVGGTGLAGTYTDTSKMYKATIPTQSGTVGAPTAQSDPTTLAGTWE
jgi:hypothetical protein